MPLAENIHVPVLPEEVLSYLSPKDGGRYLDGTLGLGGHSARILEAASCSLLGLDRDESALALASERLKPFSPRVTLRHACFSEFAAELDELGWECIDGALIDIGVSSMQLDTPERGFSFLHDGPLDMRMDGGKHGMTAARLVNRAPFEELKELIASIGEEPQAGRIARAIVEAREKKAIESTGELAAIVAAAYPAQWRAKARNHPATRTFQALRIAVNDELGELKSFIGGIVPRLAPGGRLVVITFHSLEDRMVKHFFREEATDCLCPSHIPVCVCKHRARVKILTKKPVTASAEELARNSRSSSAKLRAVEKLPWSGN